MTFITMSTIEAKEQFSELINRVTHHKERIVLTRRGKEVVAIISLEDLKLLQESQDRHDLREASEALKEARHFGNISLNELKEELEG